jgi:hypothetical protein
LFCCIGKEVARAGRTFSGQDEHLNQVAIYSIHHTRKRFTDKSLDKINPGHDKPWTRQTLDKTNTGQNKPWKGQFLDTTKTLDKTNSGHDKLWTRQTPERTNPGHNKNTAEDKRRTNPRPHKPWQNKHYRGQPLDMTNTGHNIQYITFLTSPT